MNFKFFSIIIALFITIIALFSGMYYYFFEYSKPKNYTLNNYSNNYSYTEQKSYSGNYNNSYSSNINNNKLEQNLNTYNNIEQKQEKTLPGENQNLKENITYPMITKQNDNNISNASIIDENKSKSLQDEKKIIKENEETKEKVLKKETNKEQKLKKEKIAIKEFEGNKSTKNKKLSTVKKYLSIGKNSRLEPKLSTENMKVYILDGKFLSQYRINLLKDMLSNLNNNSKDYYLSVFVKMLPKGEMKLSLYNKEIIFSNMKKNYKYINLNQLSPYLKNLKELNQHIAREEILEKLELQIEKKGKGSEFSKHIKSLKIGLDTAQYFFPFCELIEITST